MPSLPHKNFTPAGKKNSTFKKHFKFFDGFLSPLVLVAPLGDVVPETNRACCTTCTLWWGPDQTLPISLKATFFKPMQAATVVGVNIILTRLSLAWLNILFTNTITLTKSNLKRAAGITPPIKDVFIALNILYLFQVNKLKLVLPFLHRGYITYFLRHAWVISRSNIKQVK